jgi:hypothetical protein
MRLLAWVSLSCLLTVYGCAKSHRLEAGDGDVVLPDGAVLFDGDVIPGDGDVLPDGAVRFDAGVRDMGTQPDAGTTPDMGVDLGPPPPECTMDDECDDGSDCTTDFCDFEECVNFNPVATCDRFEGAECAGDLATDLLTATQTVCIPGFVASIPGVGDLSLCRGMRCNPTDTSDGCQITFDSMGLPSSEPVPDVLRVQGRITRIDGSVSLRGMVANPIGGGTVPANCSVTFGVGSGLPLSADLVLVEEMMCGSERDVISSGADVDRSMLSLRLVGGTGFNGIVCSFISSLTGGYLDDLRFALGWALEAGINAGLDGLDCGTCDRDCPADLTCIAP